MTIDFPSLAEQLLQDAPNLLRQWLPAGKARGREYAVGNVKGDAGDSLNINIDNGKWHDLATGEKGGDLISLYAAIHGIKQSEAAKRLGNGHDEEPVYTPGQTCHPLPGHKYGKPTHIAEYKDTQGQLIGYVCRFEPLNEPKQFAPLTCWRKPDGALVWKWKKWPIASPPYRLDKLTPDCKVLIVEGERTAEAAQKLLPADWVVISWAGGASAVKKTDWSALKFRYCWCWPDADEPGIKAAKQLKVILPDLHIVQIPDDLPEKWDLGDAPDGFNVVEHLADKPKSTPVLASDNPIETKEQRRNLRFTHIVKDKPLATLENMRDLFNYRGIVCRYNVISKRVFFTIPAETFSMENGEEAALACIYSYIKEEEMPTDGYKAYTLRIADENQHNPALDWLRLKPWDGISRLQDLYDTIQSPETEAKELLIRRWLITAVCMAKGEGVDSAGCLVLQGPQDLGKTWWVRKLVDNPVLRKELIRTDATVDPRDKDSVSQVIAYWLVELGEIGATFRKSDIDALKAFITRDHDTMRRPYGEGDKRYPRRTALIASVDQMIYLHDTAGNRRFWTIPCTSINSYHEIDMQQLWAEVLDLVETHKEDWRLTPDEKAHVARINDEHMQIDPIQEMIAEKYRWDEFAMVCDWKTATQIATDLGLKNITVKETRIISGHIYKLNGGEKRVSNGNRLLKVPALRQY